MSRAPSHLSFDCEPVAEQLAVLLGPGAAGARAVVREDDERITVSLQRVPLMGLSVFLLSFAGLLTSAPLWLPGFAEALAARGVGGVFWLLSGAVWALVVPSICAMAWFVQRATARLGPGAVVDKRTGDLALPWLDEVVPRRRLVRFVHVVGRRRTAGRQEPVGQHAVLFRDAAGGFVYASFALLRSRVRGGAPAQRLADFYDLRVQRVDAGAL